MTDDVTWSGSMPDDYDRLLGPVVFSPCAEHVAAVVAGLPDPPRRVLELAAGTGLLTRALLDRLPGADVTATDLNPAMIEHGRAAVPDATWLLADATDLPFDNGGFELVVCQFGLMFLPDKPAALREHARVLTPGGVLLHAVWDVVAANTLTAEFLTALAQVLPEDTPDFLRRVPHGYTDPVLMRADVAAAGLDAVAVERFVVRGEAPSAAAVAQGFCLGTPMRFELAERGPLPELAAAIGGAMTARLGGGPVAGDLAAYLITARRSH